jgi:hypothetical protein
MWILNTNTKSIQAITSLLPNTALDFTIVYIDKTAAQNPSGPDSINGTINNVISDIVPPPPQYSDRDIRFISIFNTDNQTQTVSIFFKNNATSTKIFEAVLLPNYKLEWDFDEGWELYDEKGVKKNDNSFNLSGWFGSVVPTVGQKTMANSIPVVIASDQVINVTQVAGSPKNTYSATITGLVPAATPTDIFTIIGSATKIVRLRKITVTATKNLNGFVNLIILKRSTANMGGTSTTPTIIPYDSANPSATAIVRAYTVNPTLGTLVGNMWSERFLIQDGGNNTPYQSKFEIIFEDEVKQVATLNGIAQLIAVNLGATATAMAGALFDINIEFTEE